jgi:hypothetical protein
MILAGASGQCEADHTVNNFALQVAATLCRQRLKEAVLDNLVGEAGAALYRRDNERSFLTSW